MHGLSCWNLNVMQPLVCEWMLRYVTETITFRKEEKLMPLYEQVKLYLE